MVPTAGQGKIRDNGTASLTLPGGAA
jgi:hypothetical protein